jgi:hypothetical protein
VAVIKQQKMFIAAASSHLPRNVVAYSKMDCMKKTNWTKTQPQI